MSRTYITQKQCEVSQRNDLMPRFSLEGTRLEPSSIIKAMMKIIETRSENHMDKETSVQFSKIADAVVRMTEEIKE
jgi:hypothetical protein